MTMYSLLSSIWVPEKCRDLLVSHKKSFLSSYKFPVPHMISLQTDFSALGTLKLHTQFV